jgi:carbonic anhydrase
MRKEFLILAAALTSSAFLGAGDAGTISASDAYDLLQEGNERFARNMSINPHSNRESRNDVVDHQHPFAVVLSCSDSRVPVEKVMDAGIGDLYSIRVAGNAASGEMVVGSIEYGVLHEGAKLILVLGHENCEIVHAALAGHKEPGTSIEGMISHANPASENALDPVGRRKGEDIVTEAIERNVFQSMKELLNASPAIARKVKAGEIKLVGGVYSLHTGRVKWLGKHPSEDTILEHVRVSAKEKK